MSDDKDPIKDAGTELTKPLIDELSSRLKLPFFGSFIFSWLVINWERVAILAFSKENIYTRIVKIKQIPQIELPIIGTWHTSTFVAPLIYSMLVTAMTPFLILAYKKIQKWANKRIIDTQAELNHRYQISSSAEQLKIEKAKNEVSKVKYSTEEILNKYNTLKKTYESSLIKVTEVDNKIAGQLAIYDKVKADTDTLKIAFDGYKTAQDKVDHLEKTNEHHKANLIKANDNINTLEMQLIELQKEHINLKSMVNSYINDITELSANAEIYQSELNTISKYMDELMSDSEVVAFQLEQASTKDERIVVALNSIKQWQEALAYRITKISNVTSI